MAIAPVGSPVVDTTGGTAVTSRDVTISPTAGSTLVVWIAVRSISATVSSLTATGGTATFTAQVNSQHGLSGSASTIACYVAPNIGAGITKITVTPSTSVQLTIVVLERTGVDNTTPMDVTPVSGTQASSTTQTNSSITPVTSGAEIISAGANTRNAATSTPFPATTAGPTAHSGTKAGTGWTELADLWNQGTSLTSLDLFVGTNGCNDTSGAYQADWTIGGAAGGATGAIALRPAAVAAAVSPRAYILTAAATVGRAANY